MDQICIFCLRHELRTDSFCLNNPGKGCTFGLAHEYPIAVADKPQPPPKKVDKKLCLKCGLHEKNPLSSSNGCIHEYSS